MTTFEQFSIAVAAATALINVVAVLFVGQQVRQATRQAKEANGALQAQWARERRRSTVEFLAATMKLNADLKNALPYVDGDQTHAEQVIRDSEADPAISAMIRTYLGYLEDIATGVNVGVLDLEVVDRNCGSRIINVATNFGSFIGRMRSSRKQPMLYIELERLAEAIKVRRETGASYGEHSPTSLTDRV